MGIFFFILIWIFIVVERKLILDCCKPRSVSGGIYFLYFFRLLSLIIFKISSAFFKIILNFIFKNYKFWIDNLGIFEMIHF